MAENDNQAKNEYNNQNQANYVVGGMPCYNSPRRLVHIVRPARNIRQAEMKSGLLQILFVNPFVDLDHENPHTHLTKFYELFGTLEAHPKLFGTFVDNTLN